MVSSFNSGVVWAKTRSIGAREKVAPKKGTRKALEQRARERCNPKVWGKYREPSDTTPKKDQRPLPPKEMGLGCHLGLKRSVRG